MSSAATPPPILTPPSTLELKSTEPSKPEGPQPDDGPSIIAQLRERAAKQLEQKQHEMERMQTLQKEKEEKDKRKGKLFKSRFKLKKDSPEAKEKLRILSRKDKKKFKEELERLQKLSQRELHAYMMLKDPDNQFMRKLTMEGDKGLHELQQAQIWKGIIMKKQMHGEDHNAFLNALTESEFSEFIQQRGLSLEKLQDTGRQSELVKESLRERDIQSREELLAEQSLGQLDQLKAAATEEDMTNDFKVFRDPTFKEFIQIVGKTYNPELPLFAQLYILKEVLQFYQLSQNQTFVNLCVMNILLNLSYFYFNNRFMFKRHVPFFSLTRIFIFFVFTQLIHEHLVVKNRSMNSYRVNINDLFDQDEDFLFENEHFKAMIRKIRNEFEYLVNPIFDLEDIVKQANPLVDAKYQKNALGFDDYAMNQSDLIPLYSETFSVPKRNSRLVYDKMISKYDTFFASEKQRAEKELSALVSGRQFHDLVKQCLDFYEQKERVKHRLHLLEPHMVEELKQTKKQLDGFIDGLIETLVKEFGETRVTAYASRKEKLDYLRLMVKELDKDSFYSDQQHLFKLIGENQENFLKASIGGQRQDFLPKPDLKFSEYTAIKNFFSGADFERNSFLTLTLPLVSSALWFMQRVFRRFKWL